MKEILICSTLQKFRIKRITKNCKTIPVENFMTKEIFEKLINESESSTLDFKKSEYDFSSNAPESKKAEFIKDIISFSNTVRKDTSYIIIGIEEGCNQQNLLGIQQITDDSILQQKVKGSVFPVPSFRYYPFIYEMLIFGIIEFPVKKYVKPISPTVKLKGLQPGMVYFRRNTTNDEANATEVIEINEWLNSLSESHQSPEELIHKYLLEVLDHSKNLSSIIVNILKLSKKYDIIVLKEFCEREITGLIKGVNYSDDDLYPTLAYRSKTVTISPYEINLSAFGGYKPIEVLQMLRNQYGAWEQQLLLEYSTLRIENHIKEFPKHENCLMLIKDKLNGADIYIYFEQQILISFYNSIREELKNQLIKLL